MKIKTYGVQELTEWHGKVKAGTLEVSVSFRGGTSSPSGAQPAYYMTKDPLTQFVIENSKEYRSGFIMLLSQQEVSGRHPRERKAKPGRVQKEVTDEAEAFRENKLHPDWTLTPDQTAAPTRGGDGTPTAGIELDTDVDDLDVDDLDDVEPEEVDASCLTDAQNYLRERFGIPTSRSRSKEKAEALAAENGVRLKWL